MVFRKDPYFMELLINKFVGYFYGENLRFLFCLGIWLRQVNPNNFLKSSLNIKLKSSLDNFFNVYYGFSKVLERLNLKSFFRFIKDSQEFFKLKELPQGS